MKVETLALARHKMNTGHDFDCNNAKVLKNTTINSKSLWHTKFSEALIIRTYDRRRNFRPLKFGRNT